MSTFTPKPVEFKFGEYINKGFELFKKDMGTFILAFIFVGILSIIPFFIFLAFGNFIKIARKINYGQQTSATEIFNFDDIGVHFKLFLILLAAIALIEIPVILFIPKFDQSNETPTYFSILFPVFFFGIFIAIYYFLLKAYYVVALISLENVKSIKEAWNISKEMTKGNLLMLFLFAMVTSFIGQIGIIACGIGLIISAPLTYVLQYVSYEDGIQQIKVDELEEIGKISE